MVLRDIRYAVRKNPGNRVIKVICPFHEDTSPSMAVYPDGTFCFVCRAFETGEQFLERINNDGATLPERTPSTYRKKNRGRDWVAPLHLKNMAESYHVTLISPDSPRHHKIQWYIDRGIHRPTVKKYKLGHTGTAFSIPIWNNGEIAGLRYRLDEEYHDEDELKRTKYFQESGQPILLYRPNPGAGPIVVCEGELDALALSQYGYDTVTSTGGSGSLHLECTREALGVDWVYVATDDDTAGAEAYAKLCHAWGNILPRVRWPRGKDVSEALLAIDALHKRDVIEEWLAEAEEWMDA